MNDEILLKLLDDLQNQDAKERMDDVERLQRMRSIGRDTAEFLGVLIRSCHAKNIVEIGSSHGYSTIWLALVAKSVGGKVTSFETSEDRIKEARSNIDKAGLSKFVNLILANPIDQTDKIPDNIDFVFLDAKKCDYLTHFKNLYDKISPGGTIAADNAISHFSELREYIEFVRTHPNCSSVLLSSVGKGIELTYKFLNNESQDIPWNKLIR